MDFPDTIFALSSGRLPSGIALVRMSGARSAEAVQVLFGRVPEPRRIGYGPFRKRDGTEIDRGIVLWMPGPATVTGEDCAEFHLHGGKAVVDAMLRELASFPGFRLAEAGEFTRRAFLNGKMDLTSAEGLSDLIAAETEAQRRLAVRNSGGVLRDLYLGWRQEILSLRAVVEADLDFSDQDDVPLMVNERLMREISALRSRVGEHVGRYRQSEIVRDGYRVVILGAPNAGKSSLLNALVMRDAAIVSDEPGTTRDLVEVAIDVGGYKVVVTDTAGLRETAGAVESIGIERARSAAREADLVLELVDSTAPHDVEIPGTVPRLRVWSKRDLVLDQGRFAVSTVTGEGIGELLDEIGRRVEAGAGSAGDAMPARQRHVALLVNCDSHLERAVSQKSDLVLVAEELRLASSALGEIVGQIGTEEVLGEIFGRFCIGK